MTSCLWVLQNVHEKMHQEFQNIMMTSLGEWVSALFLQIT
jgi:hypothetical protein